MKRWVPRRRVPTARQACSLSNQPARSKRGAGGGPHQIPAAAHYNLPALVASVRSSTRTLSHLKGVNRTLAATLRAVEDA